MASDIAGRTREMIVRYSIFMWMLLLTTTAEAGVMAVAPADPITEAVGIRYRFRVQAQTGAQYGKILFLASSLYSPDTCTGASCPMHQIEALIGNSTHEPQVGDCCWDGTGVAPQPPVCANFNAAPYSGLKIGTWIGGRTDPAGLWMQDAQQWPRRALGVDSSLTTFKLEATLQRDITSQDGAIVWRRGDILPADDSRTWGRECLAAPPGRPMRQWHVSVTIGDQTMVGTVIQPDDEARYLWPERTLELVTEFFEFPGVVRIFVWDVEVEREDGSIVPVRDWRIASRHPGVPLGYWGLRVADYGGDVLEFGTDPAFAYVSDPGAVITLQPRRAVSVPAASLVGTLLLIGCLVVAINARVRP